MIYDVLEIGHAQKIQKKRHCFSYFGPIPCGGK
jgi:hypothetical protein